ncbi:cupredoxin domain-containing protein, partial [Brunnivagina elsteri]|uniref:cupredoxin domain-containing protein n=1 Tax=Brunnivagina elsteri TaxID=1247191 RepID=UPI0011777DA4
IIGSIVSFGLLFTVPNNNAVAQIPHETHASATEKTSEFQYVQQPLWVKGTVTASILGLIGLEIWWFLLSKPKAKTAQFSDGIQEVTIIVDGGYEPSRVIVNVGQLVRLNFLRHDKSSCLEQVIFPDFHIAQQLNLNQITPIEFTPQKPGQYTFACGMNMFRGVVEVR